MIMENLEYLETSRNVYAKTPKSIFYQPRDEHKLKPTAKGPAKGKA